MKYILNQLVDYGKRVYKNTANVLPSGFYGLELVADGVPSRLLVGDGAKRALDNYVLNSVEKFYESNGRIIVERSGDRKSIPLNPESVRRDSQGYVTQVLANNGIRPGSSTIKKIAKALDQLKNDRK